MANLSKSLELMNDLIKVFDGEGLSKSDDSFHQQTRALLERAHRAAAHDPDLRYDIEQHLKSIPHAPAGAAPVAPATSRYSQPFEQWGKVDLYKKAEAPFKQSLATDRALATVRSVPKEPVAPVVPEHEQKLAAAHAKVEELKGLLRDSYVKFNEMKPPHYMPFTDRQSAQLEHLRNRIKPHLG